MTTARHVVLDTVATSTSDASMMVKSSSSRLATSMVIQTCPHESQTSTGTPKTSAVRPSFSAILARSAGRRRPLPHSSQIVTAASEIGRPPVGSGLYAVRFFTSLTRVSTQLIRVAMDPNRAQAACLQRHDITILAALLRAAWPATPRPTSAAHR